MASRDWVVRTDRQASKGRNTLPPATLADCSCLEHVCLPTEYFAHIAITVLVIP